MNNQKIQVFADGGSRGNPGPAAVGFVVKSTQGKILFQLGKKIGSATNNVAEYTAVIEALKWLKQSKINCQQPASPAGGLTINFYLDSQLIVNQLNGIYKIKKVHLRNLIIQIRQLEREIGGHIGYNYIPRQKNKEADSLLNQSFDNK